MSEGYQRLVERIWCLFCFDWWGIKDNMVLPRAQRIKDTKSQHIMCVVITFDVSEAGNILLTLGVITQSQGVRTREEHCCVEN